MDIGDLTSKWVSPAGMLLLLGGITWGVQLNIAVMNLTKEIEETNTTINSVEDTVQSLAATQAKITLILEHVEKETAALKQDIRNHDSESNNWKYRIIQLEEEYKNGQHRAN